ncbi:rod shape-determining protein MreC [Candidatus Parcubacteria bacterium]|nr:rod shape-determining protein MreC [Candidatus Parcubacteria bacterium]
MYIIEIMRFNIGKRKVIIIALVFLLFLFLNLSGLSKEVREVFYNISYPVQKVFWEKGSVVSNFFSPIFNAKNLNKENYELKYKNQEFIQQLIFLQGLEEENKTLRQALEINLQKEFKLVFSEIIGKDIGEDFILINKGAKDGVLEGMPVITSNKILVGRIKEVYESFSKVILLSNKAKENSFYVKIHSLDISIKAKGKGGSKLSLEMVPKDQELLRGEIVRTDILGGIFPKDLLIGEIQKVEKNDVEPFQKVEISLFFDIKECNYLFVISEF